MSGHKKSKTTRTYSVGTFLDNLVNEVPPFLMRTLIPFHRQFPNTPLLVYAYGRCRRLGVRVAWPAGKGTFFPATEANYAETARVPAWLESARRVADTTDPADGFAGSRGRRTRHGHLYNTHNVILYTINIHRRDRFCAGFANWNTQRTATNSRRPESGSSPSRAVVEEEEESKKHEPRTRRKERRALYTYGRVCAPDSGGRGKHRGACHGRSVYNTSKKRNRDREKDSNRASDRYIYYMCII